MTIDDLYPAQVSEQFKAMAQNGANKKEMPWQEMMLCLDEDRCFPVRYATSVLYEENDFMGIVNFFPGYDGDQTP